METQTLLPPKKVDDYDDSPSYNDNPAHMTWGRRLARFLSQFQWYNPHLGKENAPSIDKAWQYFEHVTLARHFLADTRSDAVDKYRKAEPGEYEAETRLYSVCGTDEEELGDFGVGVAVYFFTQRALAIIMFLAGLINIPNMMYFASEAYDKKNFGFNYFGLEGSAICTDKMWAPCPNCTRSDWNVFPAVFTNYATTPDGELSFILVNKCPISRRVGIFAFASLFFVCVAIYILQKFSKWKENVFDLKQMTSTDYSVEVENPPLDARDPEEWKAYFSQFGQVTCITVALDNEELITALMKRRKLVIDLEWLMPAGVKFDQHNITDDIIAQAIPLSSTQKLMFASDAKTIQKKIQDIDDEIATDLGQRNYGVSNIFCIFEHEQSQRDALEALSVGGWIIATNSVSRLESPSYAFRGKHVLSVIEPSEPSSVRWRDLDESVTTKALQRVFTSIVTIGLLLGACWIVIYVRETYGTVFAAFAITGMNSIMPSVCEILTTMVESHSSEGSIQASAYFKITACLWVLTAILTAFVTPFVESLDDDKRSLIPAMYAIFITELLKAPIKQVIDPTGHFFRHILAPRAVDQKRMNSYFKGTKYRLSERYTDMTNVLFLTFYYAMVFPAGFFLASATLAVHYLVDKFCLLRNWMPAPMLGNNIAELSRLYFFTAALAVYAIMSSYNFASFPYDNACKVEEGVPDEYVGDFKIETAATGEDAETFDISISATNSTYKYCNQDMLRYKPWPAFPAIPSSQPDGAEWMSGEQDFTVVYGWAACFVLLFVVLILLNASRRKIHSFFFGGFEPVGKPCSEGFSQQRDIFGYVPQAKLPKALFPTLFCDVTNIDHELIGWDDSHDVEKTTHNAYYDVPEVLGETGGRDAVFSTVTHWRSSVSLN